jgi:serine/threonine-protein kinase
MHDDEPTIDVGGILPELGVSEGGPMILAGRYLLLGMIGSGGMGTVYRARDLELGEVVAVKVLRRELTASPTFVARFRQEVKLARRVTHRNVARTFDIGEHAGDRFITMEYVEGEALSDKLARAGRLGLTEALDIAGSVCAGLAAAHAAGVIHRDLKPENILLAPQGRVVLTDFGVALPFEDDEGDTVVDAGAALIGTPLYMAPEQVEGRDVDARADLYALGSILFEMVTGDKPFKGESAWAIASARLTAPPPDPRFVVPDLPESLSRVVARLMARQPYDRFASAMDVLTELSTISVPSSPGSMRGSRLSLPSIPDLPIDAGNKAVAVLELVTGKAEDATWAAGVSSELTGRLRTLEGLRVLRPDAGADPARDPRAIGQAAGAHAVIDGVLRREAGRVAVGLRLLAVVDGFQLWSGRFERPEGELVELLDEVTYGIAQALTADRGFRPARPLLLASSVESFLRARHLQATNPTLAAHLFGKALAQSPDDPRLLSGLAHAEVDVALELASRTEAQAWATSAEAHARRAKELAPELSEPRWVLARVAVLDGRPAEGARDAQHALRTSPGSPRVQALYGAMLVATGRPRQGLNCLEHALAIEPRCEPAERERLRTRALLGDLEPFEKVAARGEVATPGLLLALARAAACHPDAGWSRALRPAAARHRDTASGALAGYLLEARLSGSAAPDHAAAVRAIVDAAPSVEARLAAMQTAAEIAVLAGDEAGAVAWIEAASAEGLWDLTWIERCPVLAPLSSRLADLHATVMRRADAVRLAMRGA